jgi:SAM-dependent methyltransferase
VRGAVLYFLRSDFQRLEAGIEAARADCERGLERQSLALQELRGHLERSLVELREHLETRLNETAAALEDLRGAYVATRAEFEKVRDRRLLDLGADLDRLAKAIAVLQVELESLRDTRIPRIEGDLGLLHRDAETLQQEVVSVRDGRVPRVEADIARLQRAVDGQQALAEELRDERLPALSNRADALIERLHEQLTEVAGLAERVARHEPLAVAVAPEIEARIPAAVAAVSTRFADAFRGGRGEILGRAAEHVRLLAGAAPVLDLGCGRGELLEALRDAGIEARGADTDRAMVAACRRLALSVEDADAVKALRATAPGTLGGVTAIHLVEHLPASAWMQLIEAAAAALRHGGLLLVETPNPESLRVGAGLFWTDPTHRTPVHADALAFVAKAVGLEVVETRLLHPFPPDQALARPDQPGPVRDLAARLDAWLSGPRDVLLVARKP